MSPEERVDPAALAAVRELAQVLAFYADRLARMRTLDRLGPAPSPAQPAAATVARPTYLSDNADYAYIAPWYRIIEPVLNELELHVRAAGPAMTAAVFADPEIRAREAKLHRLRAAFELDKEIDQARLLLQRPDPARAVAEMVESQAYWTLTPEVREALAGRRRVAVLGSGPLPLTTLAVAGLDVDEVLCIERDPLAAALGRRVIETARPAAPVRMVESGAEEVDALARFDAVLGAVLLGVDPCGEDHQNKATLVSDILDRMAPGAVLATRDPHLLGRLFYPPARLAPRADLEIERREPDRGPGDPYRSAFLIIRRAA